MEVTLTYVTGLFIVVVLLIVAAVVYTTTQRQRGRGGEMTAEGRCLRMFTTTSGGGDWSVRTDVHHVYEFTTRDGRVVRFEERGGPATRLEGDFVTVYYTEGHEAAATTRGPGHVRNGLPTVSLLLLALIVVVLLCGGVLGSVTVDGTTLPPDRPNSPFDRDTVICVDNTCHHGSNPFPDLVPHLGGN
ncbi:hypothetical protein [Nocardia sp. NPDC051570]|uniref:hypothetical protein n=1 Tax=Nocardia sp. NPDC051570 TaxID=3364324 RepID=UPI0037BDE438